MKRFMSRASLAVAALLVLLGCPPAVTPTFTVANVTDHSVIETGFVVGTATGGDSGLSAVEVKLDSGAYAPAAGTTSWKFALPSGSATWKMGSKHTIGVRVLDGAGAPYEEASFAVTKGANKDVNGDGFADVAVGAENYSSAQGRAYIFHGSSSGISSMGAGSANTILTGEATANNFGHAVALGDVNGDGYGDLVVGAQEYGSSQGRAYIFHGSSSGIASMGAGSATTILTGETGSTLFGGSVAAGDVNGDGCADVAVGAWAYGTGGSQGRTYVFHGDVLGIASMGALSADTILTGTGASYIFGYSVALGDVNRDGYADVAVGADAYSSFTGAVFIFHGISTGIADAFASSADTTLTGAGTNADFGISVALGDVNGDGYADLAVGSDEVSSYQGAAYLFNGNSTGIASGGCGSANTLLTGEVAGDLFGLSVVIGDVNGDGFADVAVGAEGYSTYQGREYLFDGSATGVSSVGAGSAGTILTGGTADYLGCSAGLTDVNGDGYADIVAGAGGYSSNQGRACVFVGSSSGIASKGSDSADTILTGEAGTGGFGFLVSP